MTIIDLLILIFWDVVILGFLFSITLLPLYKCCRHKRPFVNIRLLFMHKFYKDILKSMKTDESYWTTKLLSQDTQMKFKNEHIRIQILVSTLMKECVIAQLHECEYGEPDIIDCKVYPKSHEIFRDYMICRCKIAAKIKAKKEK